ncbi:ABC transporter permease [Aureibacter tunicatorum]|uniref:ABC-2 type transport system permease protein n=1 Tax=Aureibacter tunicatorum TaxID=866807 RepID=A0AAE3XK68_9BACT|nr:ABC transporter permease [Aureibacter tunicatorum]MDR6237509.1 ABC-2 type transport system permease protein [Aureibacter tunicatorum]BDD02543.1 ABC transporter permease [Aureibacter tunicatorum]
MRTIKFLLQKEFLQIFRNKSMIPMIFIMPIVQILVLPLTATFEIKNGKIIIVDQDMSHTSRNLISNFEGSEYFEVLPSYFSQKEAEKEIINGKTDMIMIIPQNFSKDLSSKGNAKLMMRMNAIDGSKAGILSSYAQSIIQTYNQEIRMDWGGTLSGIWDVPVIRTTFSYWYNPELNYKPYMVSGILAVLVTMICVFQSSMNIVKEKEIGTIEQINVTPIQKHEFIIGKLLPFWIIGMFVLTLGLFASKIVYGIVFLGSLWIIFSFAAIYMICVLGIGLLISTFNDTQQQSMFIAWFFMMIFILLSGMFTSLDSMPQWAQYIAWCNPLTYLINVNRMVLMKGSGFEDVSWMFGVITIYAIVVNVAAVANYKKTS